MCVSSSYICEDCLQISTEWEGIKSQGLESESG